MHSQNVFFFILEGQLYQERLIFNYVKNNTKGTQKMRRMHFYQQKPKSFQGPEADPGPHSTKPLF